MDWMSFVYGVITAGVIALLLTTTGFAHLGTVSARSGGSSSEAMPEKCKVPAGQDAASWKEHLGHHAETKECLRYFT